MEPQRAAVLDELLVLRVQSGERDAFETLAGRWNARLFRHACRLTRDRELASDALQDAWLAMAGGLHRLHDPSRFPGWAHRIVANKCRDAIRKVQRRRRLEEPSLRTMIGDVFSGRLRWLMVLTGVIIFVFFLLAVWAGVEFFRATEVEEMLHWGALLFLFTLAASFTKIFHWMEMERFAIVREIKRVELRLVQLAEELGSTRGERDGRLF